MTIKEIIERLENTTGPDRELDARIWAETDDRDVVGPMSSSIWSGAFFARNRRAPHDECFIWQPGLTANYVPHYTASLDAALTLVPAGAEYEISTLYGIAHVAMPLNADDCQTASRQDGKVALALCTAALKARLVST